MMLMMTVISLPQGHLTIVVQKQTKKEEKPSVTAILATPNVAVGSRKSYTISICWTACSWQSFTQVWMEICFSFVNIQNMLFQWKACVQPALEILNGTFELSRFSDVHTMCAKYSMIRLYIWNQIPKHKPLPTFNQKISLPMIWK